jgi:hypothetical protein
LGVVRARLASCSFDARVLYRFLVLLLRLDACFRCVQLSITRAHLLSRR